MITDGLMEKLDAHRESTNPWAVIRELKLQLAAKDADIAAMREIAELGYGLSTWTACINWRGGRNEKEWLDDLREKVEAVQARWQDVRGLPNPGAPLLAELERLRALLAEKGQD